MGLEEAADADLSQRRRQISTKQPILADDRDLVCKVSEAGEVSKDVTNFVKLLENKLEKFNAFFVEKEEWYVSRWKDFLNLEVNLLMPKQNRSEDVRVK
ncbi:SPX domain-containing protein 2-like [Pyrus communis]|uniref:SPX domain-containing protein 2-like n=1 Tax=Pyrus communis TaxID=23211 RepID=UPI0035C05343